MTTKVSSLVLANTAVTAGTYGGATQQAVITLDAQGRAIYAGNIAPSVANTQITGLITSGQIATVANTQITGVITNAQLSGNYLANANSVIYQTNLATSVTPIGVGQTWTNVTSSRSIPANSVTTYTNSTGRTIIAQIYFSTPSVSNAYLSYSINGTIMGYVGDPSGSQPTLYWSLTLVIPAGATYALSGVNTGYSYPTLQSWWELR
jgi:hypothetical protein